MIIDVQRHQFERTWRRAKNPLNRSRFHREIAQCNALVDKDKSDYYSKLISDNSHDSQKLWRELHKILNTVSDATLPSHESEKSLADQFASFFSNEITKIRDNFAPSGTEYNVHPPSDPKITVFRQVSDLVIWGFVSLQHCTGHITTGSWKGRGNQYTQFVRVLYCKLPTASNYQLSHLRLCWEPNPGLRGGRRECYCGPLGKFLKRMLIK